MTISVIILGLPKGLKHNLERNRCETGDELNAEFFAFRKI